MRIFNLSDVQLSYDGEHVVLDIQHLALDQGKLIFVVGPSGIGKSTLIEAMGLMSNTIGGYDVFEFTPSHGGHVDYGKVWNGQSSHLDDLRKKHFSFIFQNNFLLPSLSAGENMMIGGLIRQMESGQAKSQVLAMMEELDLPADAFDKPVAHLSGGQKQRLAFIRGILGDYDVLFADEPTGNLDLKTAQRLMDFLKNRVQNKGISAIIVSHDIQLALDYADHIWVVTGEGTGKSFHGVLNDGHVLTQSSGVWSEGDQSIQDPMTHVLSKYSSDTNTQSL